MRRRRVLRRRDEGGYVLAFSALLMVPLLVLSAFAIDLSSFYVRAARLQRAAEAAALAGVVWMPDLTTATSVALSTARANGAVPSGTLSVTTSSVPGNPHQLKVTITDSAVPQYLSDAFQPGVSITRSAVAEYEQPIPMGSPMNYFGTGSLNNSFPPRENVWAAVSGWCSAKENGDTRLAGYDNAYSGSGYDCSTANGAIANPDASSTGYLYAVEMPPSPPASVAVQVYDAAYYRSGSPSDQGLASNQNVTTTFQLRDWDGPPQNPYAHDVLSTLTLTTNVSGYQNQWKTVGTINNPCGGCVYYLQVSTLAGQTSSAATNGYAVRTAANGTHTACSSIVGSTNPAYSANCVRIYPHREMSIFNNLSGSVASFYLADISATYAGKVLAVDLFDVGEGATKIEVLDPNGAVTTFDWSTPCNPPAAATGGCSGTGVTSINPGVNSANQPYPRTASRYVFNDRRVTLRVPLPADYASRYGTATWWRIRYTVGSSASDRTTWSVGVEGSPVHLVE